MKKRISLLLMAVLCVSFTACGSKNDAGNAEIADDTAETAADNAAAEEMPETEDNSQTAESNTLVVYFSATGNTRMIAESIADGLSADIYEIVPEEPYTDADLNYNDSNSRCTLEMQDASARPAIAGSADHFDQYDTVFLGYPIWWGEAPRIVDTFVESYDFTGKTVIPFCTSASSGIGSSADTLKNLAGSGEWVDGQRFSGNESSDKVLEWAAQFQ